MNYARGSGEVKRINLILRIFNSLPREATTDRIRIAN